MYKLTCKSLQTYMKIYFAERGVVLINVICKICDADPVNCA
jgi:hypothetical protein